MNNLGESDIPPETNPEIMDENLAPSEESPDESLAENRPKDSTQTKEETSNEVNREQKKTETQEEQEDPWTPQAENNQKMISDSESSQEISRDKKEQSETNQIEKETSLSESQPDDPDYIAPPSYSRAGRGLVYNCKDKHWACVDKFSYFTCHENHKYNQSRKRKYECVTREVYASIEDCIKVQTYNVNQAKEASFCEPKENQ